MSFLSKGQSGAFISVHLEEMAFEVEHLQKLHIGTHTYRKHMENLLKRLFVVVYEYEFIFRFNLITLEGEIPVRR